MSASAVNLGVESSMVDCSELPANLSHDLTHPDGGKVTFVIGAGCSFEPPTNLPLSAELSREAHRRLLADRVLEQPCENPDDLSEVADAVFSKRESQEPLIRRMRLQRFINTDPNEGHRILAALMRERLVASVITLNYDDAMSQAVGEVSGREDVSEIRGPEAHDELGQINLVYLHRKADADPESLLIRKSALEEEWEDRWEEAVVRSQLIRSSSIFAGLGSPAKVLTESTKRIAKAVGGSSTFYQVDPEEYEQVNQQGDSKRSPFTDALDLAEEQYIKMGWCDFMRAAGAQVRSQHVEDLCEASVRVAEEQEEELFGTFDHEEKQNLRERIRSLFNPEAGSYTLLELGQLRARWFLKTGQRYSPHCRENVPTWLAQLLLAVDYILRRYGFDKVLFFPRDGCVRFRKANGRTVVAHLAHGQMTASWESVESLLPRHPAQRRERLTKPTCILAEGLRGDTMDPSPPHNIANPNGDSAEEDSLDITELEPSITSVKAYHLHEQTDTLDKIFK